MPIDQVKLTFDTFGLDIPLLADVPFEFNGCLFFPQFDKYFGFVKSYQSENTGLFYRYFPDRDVMFMACSWHKIYHGNNYSQYTASQVETTYENLNELWFGRLESGCLKAFEFGINQRLPMKLLEAAIRLKTKPFAPMLGKNKPYGKKAFFTDYNFKMYDKCREVKLTDGTGLEPGLIRLEIEHKKLRHLHKRRIPIQVYTPQDLTKVELLKQLKDDFMSKYRDVEIDITSCYSPSNPSEIRLVHLQSNQSYWKAIRNYSKREYDRDRSRLKKIYRMEDGNVEAVKKTHDVETTLNDLINR